MGTDDDIQMCSVESYGEDTPYGNDLEIYTRAAEDTFQEDLVSLRPCYPT